MINWIKSAWNDLIEWLKALFTGITDFLTDWPILALEGLLDGVLSVLNSIPVPSFLNTGLDGYLSGISSDVLYFLSASGFDNAIAILGAGFTFRMLRKLFTLGQW